MNFSKPYVFILLLLGLTSICLVSCEEDEPDTTITCTDGIMNGDETGVDCGGSCPDACISCTDGIMNGDETGVDCGGSCPDACITCTDGIMNGDETGVDCGGSCPDACPTCTDGIMNGDETGVDCGGSCPDACLPDGEYMTANINGVAFSANLVSGFDNGTTISFQSDQSQESQLFFEIPTGTGPGTYDVSTTGFSAEYVDFPDTYTTQSGTITIIAYDPATMMLNGTFEFEATLSGGGTASITNGAFGAEIFQ